MNAQTNSQVVVPVLAVLATPKYNRRQSRQTLKKKAKNSSTTKSLFHSSCDVTDDTLLLKDTGCYGKDAKPVVGIVSSFNWSM